MSIGNNIARLRKEKGLTQAELGDILGVSNQAVSKWESGMTMPDVLLLPALADVFGCYIDELFQRQVLRELHYDLCQELPWDDDDVIRGVICKGKKILQVTDSPVGKISFEIQGDSLRVSSELSIIVNGNVVGGCVSAGGSISAKGSITGECTAAGDITAGEWIMGECIAKGDIHAGTSITGGCTADHITAGSIFGDACGELHDKNE